jgi:hypothetical protein
LRDRAAPPISGSRREPAALAAARSQSALTRGTSCSLPAPQARRLPSRPMPSARRGGSGRRVGKRRRLSNVTASTRDTSSSPNSPLRGLATGLPEAAPATLRPPVPLGSRCVHKDSIASHCPADALPQPVSDCRSHHRDVFQVCTLPEETPAAGGPVHPLRHQLHPRHRQHQQIQIRQALAERQVLAERLLAHVCPVHLATCRSRAAPA